MRYILAFFLVLLLPAAMSAQVQVGVSFNLGIQPAWGPTGHDYAEYYYLPDIEVYYHVPQHRFYFYDGGHWTYRSELPYRFRDYDLYNSYKVVVNQRQPWRNHSSFRSKYASYKGRHGQPFIRDSRDRKYFANKNHPNHASWKREQSRSGRDNNYRDRGGNSYRDNDRRRDGVRERNSDPGRQSSRKEMGGQQQSHQNKGNRGGKGNK